MSDIWVTMIEKSEAELDKLAFYQRETTPRERL